jgi:hypothetical protein
MRVRVAKEAGLGESSILGMFFTKERKPTDFNYHGHERAPAVGADAFRQSELLQLAMTHAKCNDFSVGEEPAAAP